MSGAGLPGRCRACSSTNRPGARFCRSCGAALLVDQVPALPPVPPAPVPALPPSPVSRRSGRWRLLVLGAVAVVVVVAAVVFVGVQTSGDRDPREPVRAYFAALERRDVATLGELVGSSSPLFGADALAAGYVPPTGVEVGEVSYGSPTDRTRRPNKDAAYVTVRYQLAGASHTATVQLLRQGRDLARSWRISGGATGHLELVSPTLGRVRVAAATVPTVTARQASPGGGVEAPLGVFTIGGGADDPLWSTAAEVTVHSGLSVAVELPLTAQPAAVAEVDRQIRERVDSCAAERTLSPRVEAGRCPFKLGRFVWPEVSDARWSIVAYPVVDVRPSDRPAVDGGPATVTTRSPGTARVSYPHRGETVTETVEIDPAGVVTVDGGRLVWTG